MRHMRQLACLACVILVGCYSPPFKETEMVPLGAVDPDEVVRAYQRQIADRYESEETLVLRLFWKEIAVLGYTRVDRGAGAFETACFNHLGISLFHVSGDPQGDRLRYGLSEFKKYPKFPERVGTDIRRINFELVPDEDAQAKVLQDRVIFQEKRDNGMLEYVFGGPDILLLKKRFLESGWLGWTLRWEVSFYEYTRAGDYVYPRGVVLYDRENHYRLIVRRRDVTFDVQEPNTPEPQP